MRKIFESAQDFVWRNGRLLERQLFTYLFNNGSENSVLSALRAFQNSDGGFGNGLEPDKRCPHSQPVDVEMAFHILDILENFDNPMVLKACDYLVTITTKQGGVPFVLPSVLSYPRAPWWNTEENPSASLNPTCSLVGYLLKHNASHSWLDKAILYCWEAISTTETTQFHEIMPMLSFLENVADKQKAEKEIEKISRRIKSSDVIRYDPDTEGYVQFPLDWAPTPESSLRKIISVEIIQEHLEILKARQMEDGGWPINWVPISPGVELEWRSWKTIQALLVLSANGFPIS
ncbi:MAG: hypothetical protein JEZ06_07660 [Anaerolineaceae bacterium]|nr:hypothetical protein [Anaerolineaceae bacterium]